MPASRLRLALYWIGGVVLFFAVGLASVARWMQMAKDQRDELMAHQRETLVWSRKQVNEFWGEKASWFPDIDAEPALLVLPRSKYNEFDAIYALYRGQKGTAVLALTQVGGFFDLEPISLRLYPQTMIPRKLSGDEMGDLLAMLELIQRRLAKLDPQTSQAGWNKNVLQIVTDLSRRQAAAISGSPYTPGPNSGAPTGVD